MNADQSSLSKDSIEVQSDIYSPTFKRIVAKMGRTVFLRHSVTTLTFLGSIDLVVTIDQPAARSTEHSSLTSVEHSQSLPTCWVVVVELILLCFHDGLI